MYAVAESVKIHKMEATMARTCAVFWLVGIMAVHVGAQNGTISKVKGGYWQRGSVLVPARAINATLFTHLFYAFVEIESTTSFVIPAEDDNGGLETFSGIVKINNPDVKTLISIFAKGDEFLHVMNSSLSRQAFIDSSIVLARTNGFDGLDLDYEFPESQADMDKFASFLAEWRQAVIADSRNTSKSPLLLTAAVYYQNEVKNVGAGVYPIESISENLDFVNIMCYDFHGSWDVTATGANTQLYDNSSTLSADHGISSWLNAGLPSVKAVLGMTLYGRSWTLKNQSEAAGLGAPAVAAGPPQPVSKAEGVFLYKEVKAFIQEFNATVVHDNEKVTAYCYANNTWVSYEDPIVTTTKVDYAKNKNLGGYFFWAITQDNNWEVSTAASQAMDFAIPVGPGTPSAPSSAVGASTPTSWITVSALLVVLTSLVSPYILLCR